MLPSQNTGTWEELEIIYFGFILAIFSLFPFK